VILTFACMTKRFLSYERFSDADQSTLAFVMLGGGSAEPRPQDGLRHVFIHACSVGSGGVRTQSELKTLYNYAEGRSGYRCCHGKNFHGRFRDDLALHCYRAPVQADSYCPLKWRKVTMNIDGRQYTVFFRDALQAAQDKVLRAQEEDLN